MARTPRTALRARKSLLTKLESLADQIRLCNRRMNPGHSLAYIPAPEQAARDAEDYRETSREKYAIETEMYLLAWGALCGGVATSAINSAASRELFGSVACEWTVDNEPCNWYRIADRELIRAVRQAARAEFPEANQPEGEMPKEIFADYLQDRDHPAAAAFRAVPCEGGYRL